LRRPTPTRGLTGATTGVAYVRGRFRPSSTFDVVNDNQKELHEDRGHRWQRARRRLLKGGELTPSEGARIGPTDSDTRLARQEQAATAAVST